jgi:hypothetical protein
MVNLHKLQLAQGPGFPQLWNRLLDELQRGTIVSVSPPLMLSGEGSGQRLSMLPQNKTSASSVSYGLVQSNFQSGATLSVKPCDGNGVVAAAAVAVDVYVYAGGGSANLASVTVGGAAKTATCLLSAGKIVAYTSGSDGGTTKQYLVGDVAQVVSDVRYNATDHKLEAKVYWRVGIAVSSLSGWLEVKEFTSQAIGYEVRYDTSTTAFQYRVVSAYLPEAPTQGAWTDLADIEESKVISCTAQAS